MSFTVYQLSFLSSVTRKLQLHRPSLPLSIFLSKKGKGYGVTHLCMRAHPLTSVVDVPEFDGEKIHDDIKATDRDNALRSAVSQVAGDFCKESMLSLHRFFTSRRAPIISTGSLKLDLALGIGGLPKGRIIEIYGREASGKTTLAIHVIKEAQKQGGYCAYLDVENAMDPSFAESVGVDTEKLLISRPDSAENLLSMVNTLTKSGSIDVIVVDSVAALVPQLELDVLIGGTQRDIQSQIMNKALRKIHYSLCHSSTIIIFVNQVRSNVTSGKVFERAEEVSCGGNALRFYAGVRMRIIRNRLIKEEDKVTGLGICVQVVKNKLAHEMKKADLEIQFGRGICRESEVLDLACEHGVILKEGSNYFIEGEILRDKDEAKLYLAENEAILDKIVATLRSQLFGRER